jgi:hypothetical protein
MCLWCCWEDLDERYLMEFIFMEFIWQDLDSEGEEILNFKQFAEKNSNKKFQKTRIQKEK